MRSSELRDIELSDLLAFAEVYASLGDAVAKQITPLVLGDNDNGNPNAARRIRERLGGFNAELDEGLMRYFHEKDCD